MKKIFLLGTVSVLLCCNVCANAATTCSTSSSVVAVAASSDWDKLLNDYEQYVNQYVAMYKKAMNGDMSAMAEYAKLLEQAQKLSDKLDKAQGDMSSAQLQRYMKITQKMANALN